MQSPNNRARVIALPSAVATRDAAFGWSPAGRRASAVVAFLRPVRPNFHRDPTLDELGALGQHLAFLQGLVSAGHVVMAGPSEDGALGVVIFPHDSAAQAEERMREDPAVAAAVFTCEV